MALKRTHLLLFVVSVLLAACQEPTAKPVDIRTEIDKCNNCKMGISDVRYAAELVDKAGTMRKFDEIGCLVSYIKSKAPQRDYRAAFAMDYDGKEWLKSDEAFYVKSEAIKTPMNGGIVAFKDKARAEAVAGQFKGQVITFADLLK
jgi:copper chaperone NosL